MTQWYYAIGRRKYGPVDIGEVKTLLAGKKLNPKSYVWNPAMGSEWKHISDAPELLENPMQPESSGQKTIGPNAGTNPLDQAPAKEMPKPKTYMNPATAYMISFTRAAADRDRDRKRKKYSLGRIFGSLFRIILLIAVLYGIYYAWMKYVYKSPAARTYEEFVDVYFIYKYDSALSFCDKLSPAQFEVQRSKEIRKSLMRPTGSALERSLAIKPPPPPDIISEGYRVISEIVLPDKITVDLKIRHKAQIKTIRDPFYTTIVDIHSARLVKRGDEWKVLTFIVQRQ